MSDYILTYSKIKFYPLNPKIEDIDIVDIAHSLSQLGRANGHFPSFYSVGQHCIACCREAMARGISKRVALGCLLHDGSEAYLSDVTRPVKAMLGEYLEAEHKLQNMIYVKFLDNAPTENELIEIEGIDNAMLYHEFLNIAGEKLNIYETDIKSKPDYEFKGFETTKKEYLELFNNLTT